LSELGRREQALAAAEEATDIYRRLAAARPDAFRPDLAGSLGNLGNILTEFGQFDEALAARREAVATLAPYFLRWPARHARWMRVLARQYLESCEKLGVEPDVALLTPIVEAVQKLQEPDEGHDPNA
jgi:tetratricopeptide (TPR) repeat protein